MQRRPLSMESESHFCLFVCQSLFYIITTSLFSLQAGLEEDTVLASLMEANIRAATGGVRERSA